MGKTAFKRELLIWGIIAIPFIYCLYLWNQLPMQIATHFGSSGQANDTGPKEYIFIPPIINICYYLIFWSIPDRYIEKWGAKKFYIFRVTITGILMLFTIALIRMMINQS